MNHIDVERRQLNVGDKVYYARKRDYAANGILTLETITKLSSRGVHMGKYLSTDPHTQILKR